jgi:hypothetical protein
MSNKILNLTLFYKGKQLNFAQEGKEIKSKFEIGSNMNLFWEILNTEFPDKFELLSKNENGYLLNLHSSMSYEIQESGQTLTHNDLKTNKILTGKSISLNEKLSGKVSFLQDYEISFSYVNPFIKILSREEKALIKEFDRRQKPREGAIFELSFVFGGLVVFMSLLLYLVGQYEPVVENEIAKKIITAQRMVQQIKIEKETNKMSDEVEKDPIPKPTPIRPGDNIEEIVRNAELAVEQSINELVGDIDLGDVADEDIDLNANQEVSAEFLEVNVASEILVENGVNKNKIINAGLESNFETDPGTGSVLDNVSGLDNVINAEEFENIGNLELSEIEISDFEQPSEIATKKINNVLDFENIDSNFENLTEMDETEIDLEELPKDLRNQMASIKQQIATFRSRLINLYDQESLIVDMGGHLDISLIIAENGEVKSVDVKPLPGSTFTDEFIRLCRKLIMAWKFGVDKPAKYRFKQRLQKM